MVVDEGGVETVYEQSVDEETGEPVATKVVGEDGEEWVVDDQGNVVVPATGNTNTPPGGLDSESLTGLDSLVLEVIAQEIEKRNTSVDSLRKAMEPFIKTIENIIERENYYPPRIRGVNDELIGEGISLHIGIVNKPGKIKSRLSEAVLAIDEARNGIVKIDTSIQSFKSALGKLNEIQEDEPFQQFMEEIKLDEDFPSDAGERKEYIQQAIDQRIKEDEE